MVTCVKDCNFSLVLWGTRKSLDVVDSMCLRHLGSFSVEDMNSVVLCGKGEPFGFTS